MTDLEDLERRVAALEKAQRETRQSQEWMAGTLGRIAAVQDDHTNVLNDHTRVLNDHTQRLDRIEGRLDGVETRLGRVEADLKGLRQDLPGIVGDAVRAALREER